eukprot:m.826350 g.826350  ORF g.826350 m.826350 type:complete len:101 (+) comp23411_c0_seq2:3439-3741(+)
MLSQVLAQQCASQTKSSSKHFGRRAISALHFRTDVPHSLLEITGACSVETLWGRELQVSTSTGDKYHNPPLRTLFQYLGSVASSLLLFTWSQSSPIVPPS